MISLAAITNATVESGRGRRPDTWICEDCGETYPDGECARECRSHDYEYDYYECRLVPRYQDPVDGWACKCGYGAKSYGNGGMMLWDIWSKNTWDTIYCFADCVYAKEARLNDGASWQCKEECCGRVNVKFRQYCRECDSEKPSEIQR